MQYLAAFLISLIISLLSTPLIIKLSSSLSIVDKPGRRKINTEIVPTAGGIAIYLAFMITALVVLLWERP